MSEATKNIDALLSQLERLKIENSLLAERANDITLLGILTRVAVEERNIDQLIRKLLKRISQVKNLAYCTCGLIENRQLKAFSAFSLKAGIMENSLIGLKKGLVGELTYGTVFLTGKELSYLDFDAPFREHHTEINEVLIIPFLYRLDFPAAFVFVSEPGITKEESLADSIAFLEQAAFILVERINSIHLMQRLEQSRVSLEHKVEKRTLELNQKYQELEKAVSLRESAEREMKFSEMKFRKIFDYANEPMILWEANSESRPDKILEVNKKFQDLLGYSKRELLKLKASEIRSEKFKEQDIPVGKAKNYRFEIDLKGKDGTLIPTSVSSHRFQIGDQQVILAIHRDLTEFKIYEKQLLEERNRAQESDRLKSAFLANMSHEIRTPMNAIIGFSELLHKDGIETDDRRNYLDIISSKGRELLTIINDILYLSKMEANQLPFNPEPLNLLKYLQQSELNWQNLLEQMKGEAVEIETEFKIPEGFIINIDEVRLSQVLNNLVSNAIKFTNTGLIRVTCSVYPGQIYTEVSDTGIGIPQDKLKVIFDRFRQVEDGQTRNYSGTGLGLSIVKELVEQMGGVIAVDSKPGMGSRFFFTIPLQS